MSLAHAIDHDLLEGRDGRYRILRRLGEGGAAEIFLAETLAAPHRHPYVVAKRMRAPGAADDLPVGSLVDEARVVSRLDHPNIARALDVADGAEGLCLILECLHGEDLGEILDEIRRTSRRVPLPVAVAIAADVAAALDHAHERPGLGIVHRDVSPANVVLTYAGDVKLLDFGIAKWIGATDRTQLGFIKGKTPYLSPEQCLLAPLDRRSDVWSLGVVLYELVTLRAPFGATPGDDAAIMERIVAGDCPPADVPPPLASILAQCLHPARELRYATAAELRADLLALGWAAPREERAAWLRDLFGARNPPWLDEAPTAIAPVAAGADDTVIAPPSPRLLALAGGEPPPEPPPEPPLEAEDPSTIVDEEPPEHLVETARTTRHRERLDWRVVVAIAAALALLLVLAAV